MWLCSLHTAHHNQSRNTLCPHKAKNSSPASQLPGTEHTSNYYHQPVSLSALSDDNSLKCIISSAKCDLTGVITLPIIRDVRHTNLSQTSQKPIISIIAYLIKKNTNHLIEQFQQ